VRRRSRSGGVGADTDCNIKGWDVSNALGEDLAGEDFEQAAVEAGSRY